MKTLSAAEQEAAKEIAAMLDRRLADHEDEVCETLRRVASGDIEMVETISESDKALCRQLFGWLAEAGTRTIRMALEPILTHATRASDGPLLRASDSPPLADVTPTVSVEVMIAELYRRSKEVFEDHGLVGLAILLMSYIFYEEFHYPQAETGEYDIANSPFQKLKWVYRYWFNQLEVAERDSGLEEFFRTHRLTQFPDVDAFSRSHALTQSTDPSTRVAITFDKVSVSCAGDLLAVDVLVPENTPHLFDDIRDFYSTADIVSANLESTVDEDVPIGRHQAPGEPARMNTSQAMFDKFRHEAGINYFSTATNHAMDWGESGVLNTLEVLRNSGARYSGTAAGWEEQDDVVVVEENGVKIGLLSFTFDLNGHKLPAGKEYLANEVRFNDAAPEPDYSLVERHVAAAREKGAQFIIAYCHWGWEFEMYPHVNVTEAAHEVVARGVDVILGNHPHVSQPAQVIDRGPDRPHALVIYAFGDFVSYHPESRNSKLAYAVKFDVIKASIGQASALYWGNLQAQPLYILNAKRHDNSFDSRILRFETVLEDPDGFGLTAREKSELAHLRDVVWEGILAPLSNIPPDQPIG